MKVKIGSLIIDSNNEPILLILSDDEKEAISNMKNQNILCSYPDDYSYDAVTRFITPYSVCELKQ